MKILCQEPGCGWMAFSEDRPWHVGCGNQGCYLKRHFWSLYLRLLFFRRARLIIPTCIALLILVVLAVGNLLAAAIHIAIAHKNDIGLVVGLSLLALCFGRAFSVWRISVAQRAMTTNSSTRENDRREDESTQHFSPGDYVEGFRKATGAPADEVSQRLSGDENVRSQPLVRDAPIGSALAYIRFRTWGRSFLEATETEPRANADFVLDNFLQAAAVGAVRVWGRRRDGPFELIDKSYWREHTIDRLSLLKETPFTRRVLENGVPGTVSYADLMTSKVQVERLWPAMASSM